VLLRRNCGNDMDFNMVFTGRCRSFFGLLLLILPLHLFAQSAAPSFSPPPAPGAAANSPPQIGDNTAFSFPQTITVGAAGALQLPQPSSVASDDEGEALSWAITDQSISNLINGSIVASISSSLELVVETSAASPVGENVLELVVRDSGSPPLESTQRVVVTFILVAATTEPMSEPATESMAEPGALDDDSAATNETVNAPSGLVATVVTGGGINLNWDGSAAGVRGYNVYRDDGYIATVFGTDYIDQGVDNRFMHEYYVVAFDGNGNFSVRSQVASIELLQFVSVDPDPVIDTENPVSPTEVVALVTPAGPTILAWNTGFDNNRIRGYDLYKNGTYIDTVFSLASVIFSDEDPSGYQVVAFDDVGNYSARSVVAQVIRLPLELEINLVAELANSDAITASSLGWIVNASQSPLIAISDVGITSLWPSSFGANAQQLQIPQSSDLSQLQILRISTETNVENFSVEINNNIAESTGTVITDSLLEQNDE